MQSLVFHQGDAPFELHNEQGNSSLTTSGEATALQQWQAIADIIRNAKQASEANRVPLEDTLRSLLSQHFGVEQKEVLALAHLLADRALITALTIF